MKTRTLLMVAFATAIALLTASTMPAADHPEKADHKDGHAKVKVPDTLEGIWMEIHKHHQELAQTVKFKKLAEVHEHAFAIRDLAKGLPSKAPADHKKHVENLVKRISKIAEDLDKSGDAGDQAATEANVKKMDAALKSLEEMAGNQ